jgi:hypothetical protein
MQLEFTIIQLSYTFPFSLLSSSACVRRHPTAHESDYELTQIGTLVNPFYPRLKLLGARTSIL